MSRQLINEYRSELDRLRTITGSRRESVLREAFKDLLKRWGKQHDLQFVAEHNLITAKGNRISLDGALLHSLRVPFGYWEAKDEDDDLDKEIEAKFRKGYPRDNIVFSDDATAILYQDGHEAARAPMDDVEALLPLITRFFAHERQEIADFRKAVKQFALDLPQVLGALRGIIGDKRAASSEFGQAEETFLKHARDAINPAVSDDDVQEMLIQHILTEDIFAKVFENPDFHRQNNVAAALYALEEKLFGYGEKQKLLKALGPYYAGIQSTAAMIESHSEKQGFLKGLYENFYKVYNPQAADRLGVVYTPGEIVRFMIRSADWLCEKHFGKNLVDKGVEILDPATGTGTFIVELLEHFRGNRDKLAHKYKEELHANEVAILPYYVANLNIEATYAAITGQFAEYPNLCFVDTLDNIAAIGIYSGHQGDMFGSVSDENLGRIKRQNERKISVIIGNPPYNAWQENYNARNANRPYKRIDERIGQTYRALSKAQNTSSLSDMYVRFWRWASDRIQDEGVVAFICNRNLIEKVAFDGFRKTVGNEFAEIWVVDLGGDVRANPRLSGTKHNVFGIQTGVAIVLMVRRKIATRFRLFYTRRPEEELAQDKLAFLSGFQLAETNFTAVAPDGAGNWLGTDKVNEWTTFAFLADPTRGPGDIHGSRIETIFRLSSNGVQTKRNDWAWATTRPTLAIKIKALVDTYEDVRKKAKGADPSLIKWDAELDRHLRTGSVLKYDEGAEIRAQFRPFSRAWLYFDRVLNSRTFRLPSIYRGTESNPTLAFRGIASQDEFTALAVDRLFDLDMLKTGNGTTQGVSRYRYTKSGERVDNITDWAVAMFRAHYPSPAEGAEITKDAIFTYVYAILHDPLYREKYALNLKREFPRIPFYPDFARWAAWGQHLLDLHIGYEDAAPFALVRTDTPNPRRAEGTHPKPKLKSNADNGTVVVDEDTLLGGIPTEAWAYRLGNRSAIDWVLDQHKEKTPRDPTIREKFNSYRFADYKESMIALLAKVVTVSVETLAITEAMRVLPRDGRASP